MEDGYIMMVDENGQPFICHAGMFQKAGNAIKSAGTSAMKAVRGVGRGRGTRQNHKYLMKVGTPERPRYLYTQEEVRAYLQGGRRALNNAANKAGQTAKNAVNTAKNTANKAGQATKNAVNTAKNAVNKTVDVVKDKAGVDERKRAEEAWDKVPRRVSSDDKEAVDAFRKATEAQKEYRKTPLGAAEYAKERAYEIATGQDGTAKEIAEKVAGKAKEKATEAVNKVVETVKDKAGVDERERLRQAEKDADSSWRSAQRMKDAANKRFQDYLHEDDHDKAVNYRDRQKKLDNAANKMREDSLKDLQKAKSDYDKTLLGTIDKVKDKAGADEKERLQKSQKEFVEAEAKKRQMLEDYRKITDEMSTFEMSGPGWQENANLLIERANKISEDIDRQNEVVKQKFSEAEKAQKEYNRTLMGFVDAVKNRKKSK